MKFIPRKLKSWIFLKFFNKIKLPKGSSLTTNNSILKWCRVDVKGKNCKIELGKNNVLINCRIEIFADNCHVRLGDGNDCSGMWLWVEDAGSRIVIGNDNRFTGKIQLAAIEGTRVVIGNKNLFSRGIQISSGDSHSIIDLISNKRINPSGDIIIGNHIWIGMGVTVTKSVEIADDIIIGRGSIVTKSLPVSHVTVAGIPARVQRENVSWHFDKLPWDSFLK